MQACSKSLRRVPAPGPGYHPKWAERTEMLRFLETFFQVCYLIRPVPTLQDAQAAAERYPNFHLPDVCSNIKTQMQTVGQAFALQVRNVP